MPKTSAGLLMYRWRSDDAHEEGQRTFDLEDGAEAEPTGPVLEVLLVHPGGPYWAKKDAGAWSIPKGELDDEGEDKLAAAVREFLEETGLRPEDCAGGGAAAAAAGHAAPGSLAPRLDFVPLGAVKMQRHKIVHAWAFEGDCEPGDVHSNAFAMEWPPRSGRSAEFPEVDRAGWFELPEARVAINASQRRFLDDLEGRLGVGR